MASERVRVHGTCELALASYNGMQGYENWMEHACQASCTRVCERVRVCLLVSACACMWMQMSVREGVCMHVPEMEIRLTEENRRARVGAESTNYDPLRWYAHTLIRSCLPLVWASSACLDKPSNSWTFNLLFLIPRPNISLPFPESSNFFAPFKVNFQLGTSSFRSQEISFFTLK